MAWLKVEPSKANHNEDNRPPNAVHRLVDIRDNGLHIFLIGSIQRNLNE